MPYDYLNRVSGDMEFEESDNTYAAWHSELECGSCYGTGATAPEAITELEKDKKEFITLLMKEGKPIPMPAPNEAELPSGQFIVRVPRTLHKKIKDCSEKENVSINQLIVSELSEYVGEMSFFNSAMERYQNAKR